MKKKHPPRTTNQSISNLPYRNLRNISTTTTTIQAKLCSVDVLIARPSPRPSPSSKTHTTIRTTTTLSETPTPRSPTATSSSSITTVLWHQHAINILEKWILLHKEDLPENLPVDLILLGIRRLMEFNVFTFGSRYFLQLNGTAMGTNIACMWTTIYYSYYKETKLRLLLYMNFHRHLIDDAIMIVDKDVNIKELLNHMDAFRPVGKRLTWDTDDPTSTANLTPPRLQKSPHWTSHHKTSSGSFYIQNLEPGPTTPKPPERIS